MVAQQFSVYDFIVDIIPGGVAIILIISILPESYATFGALPDSGLLQSSIFLVLSYPIGHLVQAVASPVDTWLAKRKNRAYPFEDQLTLARRDKASNKTTVRSIFLDGLRDYFGDEIKDEELFYAVQSYLLNNDIGQMKRFQFLYTFFRSLWVLFFGALIIHLLALIGSMTHLYNSIWKPDELMIISGLLLAASWLSYQRRVKFHKRMTKAMIFDFYTSELV